MWLPAPHVDLHRLNLTSPHVPAQSVDSIQMHPAVHVYNSPHTGTVAGDLFLHWFVSKCFAYVARSARRVGTPHRSKDVQMRAQGRVFLSTSYLPRLFSPGYPSREYQRAHSRSIVHKLVPRRTVRGSTAPPFVLFIVRRPGRWVVALRLRSGLPFAFPSASWRPFVSVPPRVSRPLRG